MSNKNFDQYTITNFISAMKGKFSKFAVDNGLVQRGIKTYKEINNCKTVSGIKAFESLKKDVLLADIQTNPKSITAKRYDKFDFKNTADLKKEDLLNKLPLNVSSDIRDLLDLVDDFCLDAKDFEKAVDIFSDICITGDKSDLRGIGLKFVSKFKKGTLTWKQIQDIWKICDNQQAHSKNIYVRGYVGVVHSALETLAEKQKIAYGAGFIKNFVVNMLRPNDPNIKNSTDIKWLKEAERQELGDYLFGVICMLLIHSKEYLEGREMDALNDFFGDNKKGSFSSKIGSNILELIKGGFVGALFAVYLNDGCFEKSQNEYVVKLRDMLKENQCELKVESNEHGEKIVFKNNQEKTVESPLENMEGKIMSNKNFDQNTITNFITAMNGKISVDRGIRTYKERNNCKTVSGIEAFESLKKDVLLADIQTNPTSETAIQYNKFKFENTADLKKEDLLNKLPLNFNCDIRDLLDLVDNFCLNAKDFEKAVNIFSDICITNDESDLREARLAFMSKFKRGSLTWEQIQSIWEIGDNQQAHSKNIYFHKYVLVVLSALETLEEKQKIAYDAGFIKNFVVNMLRPNNPNTKYPIDIKKLKNAERQKLGDYLFGVICMLLIHSEEYLEGREMDALNDFFGDNKKGSFSSKIGSNILEIIFGDNKKGFFIFIGNISHNIFEIIGGGFVEALFVVYLKDGYFEKSQNEYVVKLRDMLKENQCELKVENDEEGKSKIVFKNNREKTVESPSVIKKYKEDKDINSANKKDNETKQKEEGKGTPKIVFKNDQEKTVEQPLATEAQENVKVESENNDQDKINENEDSAAQHKESIWLVILDRIVYFIVYFFLFVFTLGSPLWRPSLTEKVLPDLKISKDHNKVNKSILPNTPENKGKDENNVKLENNNKNENEK